jgi:hypothetical protein
MVLIAEPVPGAYELVQWFHGPYRAHRSYYALHEPTRQADNPCPELASVADMANGMYFLLSRVIRDITFADFEKAGIAIFFAGYMYNATANLR